MDSSTTYYEHRDGVYPIGFRIYYGDLSIFSFGGDMADFREAWGSAPQNDVQFIIIFENTQDALERPTRVTFAGRDYYFFDGETFGATDDLTRAIGTVLYGEWVSDEIHEQINALANEDYDLP